jgi:hypothetical protein
MLTNHFGIRNFMQPWELSFLLLGFFREAGRGIVFLAVFSQNFPHVPIISIGSPDAYFEHILLAMWDGLTQLIVGLFLKAHFGCEDNYIYSDVASQLTIFPSLL